MAATRASKLVTLTNYNTGAVFSVSTNKIIWYKTTLSTHSQIKYLNNRGSYNIIIVDESVSTIHTATQSDTLYATQAITLVDGTVLYVNCDRVIYIDTLASTYMLTYDEGSEKNLAPKLYEFSTPTAANFNTAAGNTFAITTQPTTNVPSQTRYINNLLIDGVNAEPVTDAPVITFTTKVKTGTGLVTTAGSGYVNPVVAITGGGGTGATGTVTTKLVTATPSAAGTGYVPADTATITGGAIVTVATTKLITTAVNAAGTGMVAGTTVLTMVGGTGTAATATVATTKVVSATVASGGTGDLADGAGVIVEGTTGTGTKFRASVTIATNAIASVQSITVAGNYTVNPTDIGFEPVIYISGAGGGTTLTGAELDVVMGALTVTVATGGSYTANAASFTSTGGGNDATFNTTVFGANTLTVSTAGSYSGAVPSNPIAQTATTGAGTGLTVTGSFGLNTFTITAAGTGFTSYPVFGITDAGGTLGVITASMLVESPLVIVDGGTNINTAPTLTFSATTGTLATATATIDEATQTVDGTTLTNAGAYKKGTDAYPTLTISGGAGCQVLYDAKLTAFVLLQLQETKATIDSTVNAL